MAKTSRLSKMIAKVDKALSIRERDAVMDNGKPICPKCNDNISVVRSWQKLPALMEAIETRFWCWGCSIGFTSPGEFEPTKKTNAGYATSEVPESPVFGAVTEVNDA